MPGAGVPLSPPAALPNGVGDQQRLTPYAIACVAAASCAGLLL
jgi:hypothetical protein